MRVAGLVIIRTVRLGAVSRAGRASGPDQEEHQTLLQHQGGHRRRGHGSGHCLGIVEKSGDHINVSNAPGPVHLRLCRK